MSWSGRSAVSYVSFLIRCVGPLSVCAWPTMRLSPFWPKRNRGRQPIPAATERWHTHCALVEQPIRQADGGMRLTCILKTHKQRQDRQAQAHMTFWMCVADNKTVVIKITTARSACFGLLPHVILLVNWEETFFLFLFSMSRFGVNHLPPKCVYEKKNTQKNCDVIDTLCGFNNDLCSSASVSTIQFGMYSFYSWPQFMALPIMIRFAFIDHAAINLFITLLHCDCLHSVNCPLFDESR